MPKLDLEAIKARHAAATPGPYKWVTNSEAKHIELTGRSCGWGRRTIWRPVRWGMNSAAFVLLDHASDLLERVETYFKPVPGHEHHSWMKLIDHPDAVALEHSWQDVEDLIARVEELEAAIQAKCAYCRESWDAGLDDPAFCPTNCPLLPYRGGE